MAQPPSADVCRTCGDTLSDGAASCQRCGTTRNSTWAIMFAEDIAGFLDDGVLDVLEMIAALSALPRYTALQFTPAFVSAQMRLCSRDTSALARQLAKARSARMMLEVMETGDTKDKIAVMKGIQVLGDVVEHTGTVATTVTHVYEEAPKREK